MNTTVFYIVLAITLLTACTHKSVYDITQPKNGEIHCAKLPDPQYQECKERETLSYQEYLRERERILNEDKSGSQ